MAHQQKEQEQKQPTQSEDPFADLPPLTCSDQLNKKEMWINSIPNYIYHSAIDPIDIDCNVASTKIKILKRQNTLINHNQTSSGSSTSNATSHDLESRAKVKEEQYQRARERIMGANEDSMMTNQAELCSTQLASKSQQPHTPTRNETTSNNLDKAYPLQGNGQQQHLIDDTDEFRRYPVTFVSSMGYTNQPMAIVPMMNQSTPVMYHQLPTTYATSTLNPAYLAYPPQPTQSWPPYSPTSPVLGWDPVKCPPIGYINLPGIPPLPIPPPPLPELLAQLNLPTPSIPPPFQIYPPAPYLPPPFVLFPPHPTEIGSVTKQVDQPTSHPISSPSTSRILSPIEHTSVIQSCSANGTCLDPASS